MSLNRHTIDTQFTYIIYIIYKKTNQSIDSRVCSKNWLKMYKNKVWVCGGLYTVGACRKCKRQYCHTGKPRFWFSFFLERAEAVIRHGTKCCFSHWGGEVPGSPNAGLRSCWVTAVMCWVTEGACTVPGREWGSCRAVACRCTAVSYHVAVVSWNTEGDESKLLVPTSLPPHRAILSGAFWLNLLRNLRIGWSICRKWSMFLVISSFKRKKN